MSDKRLIVVFPQMHAAMRRDAVGGPLRLDPGIAPEGEGTYAPADLPLDRATARGWLAQAQGYAGLFKKPGELLAAYMSGGDDYYANSAQAIVSELRAMEGGGPREPEAVGPVRAQCALLLAFVREQAMLEVGGLDAGVESAWDDMGKALGLDEEDAAELAGAAQAQFLPDLDVSLYEAPEDWAPVLEAFVRLTPPEAVLYVDDPGIVGFWRELGVEFAEAGADLLDAVLPERGQGAWMAGTATGYALLNRRAADDAALGAERTVLVPAAAMEDA